MTNTDETTVDKLQRCIPEAGEGASRGAVISHNTPAHRAEHRPQSRPVYTQSQLADRRRRQLPVTLEGGWSLSTDVAAICDPLAEAVAAAKCPPSYWRAVDQLTDAVHGTVKRRCRAARQGRRPASVPTPRSR